MFLLVDGGGACPHLVHGEDGRVLPHEEVQVLAGLVDLPLELVHPLPQRVLHLVPLVADPRLGEVEHCRHVLGPVEHPGRVCCHHWQFCPQAQAASPGVELDVLLGQQGAVQQEEDALGGDVDSLHQRGHGLLHAGLQVALQLHQLLATGRGAVSGKRLELQTKVPEDCAKTYNHGKGPI